MKRLELAPEEQELLLQVLRSYQARLEVEIQHTDHSEFKKMLKERRTIMDGLVERIAAPMEAGQG